MTSRVHQIEGQYCSSQPVLLSARRRLQYSADSDIQSFTKTLFDLKNIFFPEEGSQILSLITYPPLEIQNRGRDLFMAPKNKSNQ